MNAKNILLVEDDVNLGTIIKEYLSIKGFTVTHSLNGETGLASFKQNKFDICIIDIMMPKMDGFSLSKKIKEISSTPFIFLTAKSMLEDKIEGFKTGADDYITKPFSMEELILRINVVLRRNDHEQQTYKTNEFSIGSYIFNYEKRKLVNAGKEQKLTSKEAELLKLLCENENILLERSAALSKIWKDDNYFTSRSMDVYITKLRGYLKNDPQIQIINVHGSGFKLIT